jgi:MFS family permease
MERTPSFHLSRRAAQAGLALMTLLNFVNYIDRVVLMAVLPRIKAELALSDAQLGLLGSAFMVVYFLTSPIFGRLGDRLSRTRLIAAGVTVWSVATALAGVARNVGQLVAARATVGIGEASYATISPSLISDYFPLASRGRVFAIFYVAIPVGSAAGYVLGGLLERQFGWRAAFFAVGLPGLLLALLALAAPDPPRGLFEEEKQQGSASTFAESLRLLAANRVYVLTVLGYAAYTFALGGLSYWIPSYLSRVRGMDLTSANLRIGMLTVVAGLIGTFAGGYLGDVLARRVRQAYLWVSGVSMLVGIPFAWVALTAETPVVYLSAFFAGEVLLFLSTGPINVVIVSVVPVTMRATAMAVSIFGIHLFGDAVSPWAIGEIADLSSLARAVLIVPLMIAVSGLIWAGTAWQATKHEARVASQGPEARDQGPAR